MPKNVKTQQRHFIDMGDAHTYGLCLLKHRYLASPHASFLPLMLPISVLGMFNNHLQNGLALKLILSKVALARVDKQ